MQIATTQRECDDIIACTAPSPVEQTPYRRKAPKARAQDASAAQGGQDLPHLRLDYKDIHANARGLKGTRTNRARTRTSSISCIVDAWSQASVSGVVDTEDDVPDTEPQLLGSTSMKGASRDPTLVSRRLLRWKA